MQCGVLIVMRKMTHAVKLLMKIISCSDFYVDLIITLGTYEFSASNSAAIQRVYQL
jgi:hypothetical protein